MKVRKAISSILIGVALSALACSGSRSQVKSSPPAPPADTAGQGADGRLLVNLFMEGGLAWFGWQGRQEHKPKLEVTYRHGGEVRTKTYQHGLEGGQYPQSLFLLRGPNGGVNWAKHPEVQTREAHKHNFFSKPNPARVAFVKADISDIPPGAEIVKATLWLHIHDKEGLKAGPSEGAGRIYHFKKDWNWDVMDFEYYDVGKRWSTPLATYPFFGEGELGPRIVELYRQRDLAQNGYHKTANTNYPLEVTDYVQGLQKTRRP